MIVCAISGIVSTWGKLLIVSVLRQTRLSTDISRNDIKAFCIGNGDICRIYNPRTYKNLENRTYILEGDKQSDFDSDFLIFK